MGVLAWILGVLLALIGSGWSLVLCYFRPLIKEEILLLRQEGSFAGEPESMRTFRVLRAETDLLINRRLLIIARSILFLGLGIILVLVFTKRGGH